MIAHVSDVLTHQQVIARNVILIILIMNTSFLSVDLKECAVAYVQPIIIIQKIKQLSFTVKVVMLHVSDVQIHQQVIARNVILIIRGMNTLKKYHLE